MAGAGRRHPGSHKQITNAFAETNADSFGLIHSTTLRFSETMSEHRKRPSIRKTKTADEPRACRDGLRFFPRATFPIELAKGWVAHYPWITSATGSRLWCSSSLVARPHDPIVRYDRAYNGRLVDSIACTKAQIVARARRKYAQLGHRAARCICHYIRHDLAFTKTKNMSR